MASNFGLGPDYIVMALSGITGASVTTAWAYIAGGMLGDIRPRLPFWVAAALTLINAVYGLFVLPESLPREKRAEFRLSRANRLGALQLLRSRPRLMGLASVVVQGGLVRPFVRWFGERAGILAGMGFGAVGFASYGLAPTAHAFWAGVPVVSLMGLFGPSEQGRLPGANTSTMAITGVFAPSLFALVFASVIGPRAGLNLEGAP